MDDDVELADLKRRLENAVEAAENLTSELTEQAGKQSTLIAELQSAVAAAADSAASVSETKGAASTAAADISLMKNAALVDIETVNRVAHAAANAEEDVTEAGRKLAETVGVASDLAKEVTALLPGATSAGLAAAFRERKLDFRMPKSIWAGVFILSMLALFAIAYVDPVTLERGTLMTTGDLFEAVLRRIPFLLPVVWLAIYASTRNSQALRLEEEYAHKETVAKSFKGYKQQIEETEGGGPGEENGESMKKLVELSLDVLARHPSRIYESKQEDISPVGSFFERFKGRGDDEQN
ncbi:MAG: hypothetical protein K0U72_09725 [Gammaproteobacteria bacterium]|nr:hypothetical protein [Gammaproteobacteria bacterium]